MPNMHPIKKTATIIGCIVGGISILTAFAGLILWLNKPNEDIKLLHVKVDNYFQSTDEKLDSILKQIRNYGADNNAFNNTHPR